MDIEDYKEALYINDTVNYINFCKRRANEMLSSDDFNINEYNLLVERYIAIVLTLEQLFKILGIKLIMDKDGFYRVVL